MIHCLMSDTDPTRPTQTTPYTGETCKFTGRKPLICWGRKNPMSYLSRMKNPGLPLFVHSSSPAGLRLYTASLDVFELLRNHCFLLWLIKARVYYILAMPCQLLAVSCYCCFCFLYLNHPLYAISCINYCYIRYASSPPK